MNDKIDNVVDADSSAVWGNHISIPDTPEGFTLRTTYPVNPDGAEVMLERWEAGTSEPPHSHPGDDMTVVIEGKMSIIGTRSLEYSFIIKMLKKLSN